MSRETLKSTNKRILKVGVITGTAKELMAYYDANNQKIRDRFGQYPTEYEFFDQPLTDDKIREIQRWANQGNQAVSFIRDENGQVYGVIQSSMNAWCG